MNSIIHIKIIFGGSFENLHNSDNLEFDILLEDLFPSNFVLTIRSLLFLKYLKLKFNNF